jgi:hypothetical protein
MAGISSGILNQEAHPLFVKDGTSNVHVTPRPGVTSLPIALARARQGLHDLRQAWGRACTEYFKDAALKHCGEDASTLLDSLIPGLVFTLKVYLGTVGAVTLLGAGLGSLAGGAGAVPGAIAGAKLGNVLALAVLEVMGAGFLAAYIVAHIKDAKNAISAGCSTAWDAEGSPAAVDLAARQIADGLGVLMSLVLQALIAYALKKGVGPALEKLKKTRSGQALGDWLRRNIDKASRPLVSLVECLRRSGMKESHFRIFQRVARDENLIVAVRNTNVKSVQWIEKKCPPKPKPLEPIHTDPVTGIVTAVGKEPIKLAHDAGFYVVDANGIARNAAGAELKLAPVPGWKPKPGEVIHPTQAKPIVGDYDLMGVIDPKNKGQVIAGVPKEKGGNWSNPQVDKVKARVNDLLRAEGDQPRVMHGSQDLYGKFKDGGVTVFMPDGQVLSYVTDREFYAEIGRETIKGSYTGDPAAGPPVPPAKGPPKLTVLPGGKK